MNKLIVRNLLSGIAVGVLLPHWALAQDVGDNSSGGAKKSKYALEEVIVQAQRRAQSANDVPIAVTAISSDQIAAKGITDTRDLHGFVPGLIVSRSAQGAPVYTLRGVGFNDASVFATPTTAVYRRS